jgi:methyl-accepting chemotaxis protein
MNFLSNLRIGARLALAFAVVLGLSVISTGIALVSSHTNAEAARVMMQSPLAKERLVSDWYVHDLLGDRAHLDDRAQHR